MSKEFKFYIKFGDGRLPADFWSTDVRKKLPRWGDEEFNRPIEELQFHLPRERFIVLKGYEAYNFFVEATQSVSVINPVKLHAFYFLGKLPGEDKVVMWRIDKEKISFKEANYGYEYNGTATRGWKTGLAGKPFTQIFRM